MSYKLPRGQLYAIGENYESGSDMGYLPAPTYETYPLGLGQLAPPAPLPTSFSLARVNVRQVMMVVVVVAIVAFMLYQLMKLTKKATKVERNNVVSRLSTKELATRLYDRLESKGSKTNNQTMRSLERLAR